MLKTRLTDKSPPLCMTHSRLWVLEAFKMGSIRGYLYSRKENFPYGISFWLPMGKGAPAIPSPEQKSSPCPGWGFFPPFALPVREVMAMATSSPAAPWWALTMGWGEVLMESGSFPAVWIWEQAGGGTKGIPWPNFFLLASVAGVALGEMRREAWNCPIQICARSQFVR